MQKRLQPTIMNQHSPSILYLVPDLTLDFFTIVYHSEIMQKSRRTNLSNKTPKD